MAALVRYRSITSDSNRWDGFRFRTGDIVISTPPKAGTTWMQMLCALLIFDGADLDRPLTEISPWMDMLTAPLPDVRADLDAQQHRRFIKTHTPLDGLPLDDRVTYLCVGRDPRDIGFSWDNHMANLDVEKVIAARLAVTGPDPGLVRPPAPPADPLERFWAWVDADMSSVASFRSLTGTLHHLRIHWERRREANIGLFHYGDMLDNLTGELARLAAVLEIDLPATRLAELAETASFARMKARADVLAPEATRSHWRSNDRFFDKGPDRRWQDTLDVASAARYDRTVTGLAGDPDFLAWVHGGRRALD